MGNPTTWFGSWFRERDSGIRTVEPTSSHAADAAADANGDLTAADVRLGLRAQFAAVSAGHRKGRRAERRTARAARSCTRLLDWESRRTVALNSRHLKSWLVEIAIHERVSSRMGRATSWINQVLIWVLVAAMLANDPFMIYTSVLRASDVLPESIGLADLVKPTVLIAVFSGVGTAMAILIAVAVAANALAALLFRGQLKRFSERYPAAALSDEQTPNRYLGIKAGAALTVLVLATLFLHGIAEANFTQSLAQTFSGTAALGASIVLYVTALPWVLLVLETIAKSPQQAHYRECDHRALTTRLREARDIRTDQRLMATARKAVRRARLALVRLLDALSVTAGYLLYEATDSDLKGFADLSSVATIYRQAPVAGEALPLDLSGRVSNPYLPGLPTVSPTIANAINSFRGLPEIEDEARLVSVWKQLRTDAAKAADAWLGEREEPEPVDAPAALHLAPASGD